MIKHLLQDDRWERSSKLIYIPCYYEDDNQVFFKPVTDLLAITSSLFIFIFFIFYTGQTAVNLSGAEAADRAQCAALTNRKPNDKGEGLYPP